jgi:uncharacterized protein
MIFLIDGFNLIYKFPDLEGLMYEGKLSEARKGLLDKLKDYGRITGARMRVVFDGKKDHSLGIKSEKYGKIDVYYSLDYSADYLIKEFIKKDINPRQSTVITSDKDIIAYVSRFKAKVKKSEDFAEQMNRDMEKIIEAKNPEKEENPLVTDEEVSFWQNLFSRKKKSRLQ